MKAKPLSGDSASKNFRKASRPPADAPMPTTGNTPGSRGASPAGARRRGGRAATLFRRRRCPFVILFIFLSRHVPEERQERQKSSTDGVLPRLERDEYDCPAGMM